MVYTRSHIQELRTMLTPWKIMIANHDSCARMLTYHQQENICSFYVGSALVRAFKTEQLINQHVFRHCVEPSIYIFISDADKCS